jgi:hypothetical protein
MKVAVNEFIVQWGENSDEEDSSCLINEVSRDISDEWQLEFGRATEYWVHLCFFYVL